ncbi:hypothetical protein N9B72_00590 [Bacteriovoracaceae bacterium]|nr:hypothetical protein [Bacteriovoracaceae bacterium]
MHYASNKIRSNSTTKTFASYLANPFHSKSFKLSTGDKLYFSWVDAGFTTEFVKNLSRSKNVNYQQFLNRHKQLKNIPMWIKRGKSIKQWALYELYRTLILHGSDFCNENLQVSFISPLGPFQKEKLKNIINPTTYNDIVIDLLLKEELNCRNFRFRVDGLVKSYVDKSNESYHLKVAQVSSDGILFSLSNYEHFKKIQSSKELNFLFDTSILKKTSKGSLASISNAFSKYPFELFFTNDHLFDQYVDIKNIRFTYQYDNFSEFTNFIYISFRHINSLKDPLHEHVCNFSDNLKSNLKKEISHKLVLIK